MQTVRGYSLYGMKRTLVATKGSARCCCATRYVLLLPASTCKNATMNDEIQSSKDYFSRLDYIKGKQNPSVCCYCITRSVHMPAQPDQTHLECSLIQFFFCSCFLFFSNQKLSFPGLPQSRAVIVCEWSRVLLLAFPLPIRCDA